MWTTLALFWTAVIVFVTTLPWRNFAGHSHWNHVRWIPFQDHPLALFDIMANLLLFAPFGYFLVQALPRRESRSVVLPVLGLAAALSASVECFQVYCHHRIPSTTDVLTNVLGAGLGLLLALKRQTAVK
jgi:glycopeptide antibiotics resistance protein